MTFHRRFAAGLDGRGQASFENVQTHDVAIGVVQHQREEIEVNDAMKPLCQVVKKRGKIAMLRDRFRHFEQGFELTPGVLQRRSGRWFGRQDSGIRHRNQNSIRVTSGSTEGVISNHETLAEKAWHQFYSFSKS